MGRIQQRVPGLEAILLGVFVIVTVWILVGSLFLDSEASKLFPRLTSGIVVALLVLFFIAKVLPDDLLDRLPDQEALTYGADETESDEFDEYYVALVFVMFGVYLAGVYVLGFLIATPLYVYGNMWYFSYGSRRKKLAVTGATFVIVNIAYEVFRIPLEQGVLFKTLL